MNDHRRLLQDLGLPKKHDLAPRDMLRMLAAAQDGQFANRQALALGLGPSQVLSLRDRGETERIRQRVWRFRTAVANADAAVSAFLACWPDGVISHASAAAFHGLTRVPAPEHPE